MAGLEEEIKKDQVGGIVVGDSKAWSISNADGIVLIADREVELKDTMYRFMTFLKEVELELNTERTKVVVVSTVRGETRSRDSTSTRVVSSRYD